MGLSQQLSLRLELFLSALRRKRGPVYHNRRGAICGYDPVAYFVAGQGAPGKKNISYVWNGARWYFDSEESRDLFAANPERYAPQFGGFCAYGVHNGYKIHSQPDCWTIFEGKLYLNYNRRVQEKWRADPSAFIETAKVNWERLKKKY